MFITCLHIPHFPAVAARMALRATSPVLVHARGRVVAATVDARQYGVVTGDALQRARQLVPQAVAVQRSESIEVAAWQQVMQALHRVTPLLFARDRGTAWMEVDDTERITRLLTRTDAQAGMAPTRTLALLAALRSAPRLQTHVHTDDISAFLATWPTVLLREVGVSDDTIERLTLFGFTTLAPLRTLTRHHLHVQFGADGLLIHDLLRSMTVREPLPLYQPPAVVRVEQRVDPPEREPGPLVDLMRLLVDTAQERLQRRRASMLTVSMQDEAGRTIARASRILRTATDDLRHLHAVAETLVRSLLRADRRCAMLVLECSGLLAPRVEQTTLFAPKRTADDVAALVLRRYPRGLVRARITDPFTLAPERAVTFSEWTTTHATDQ